MKTTCFPLASVSIFLFVVTLGCGAPEAANGAHTPARNTLAFDPGDYRCEPLSTAALTIQPPPAPVLPGESVEALRSPVPSAPALCPSGQVPRAVNVPEVLHRRAPSMAAEDRPVTASSGTYYYAGVMKPTAEVGHRSGVGALIQIVNPAVAHWEDMVTAQTSIVQGNNTSLVEIGLRKFKTTYPTLLIGNWIGGVFRHVDGWVQVHPTYFPGMSLNAYVGLKLQFYIRYSQGNWWVWFNDGWAGYFPGSNWGGTFTGGDMAHWYGEVYDYGSRVPPVTDMGNGLLGSHPSAATIEGMCVQSSGDRCHWISGAWLSVTNASYYNLSYPGGTSMRYGGHGGG